MPIKIPDALPARTTLEEENIFVMTDQRAIHQDIRPLKLLILNLMPTKIVTETQLLRKLSNTPLQIEVELLHTVTHEPANVDSSHLDAFYVSFDEIRERFYDGMIITGAPVENLEYSDVDYWDELCRIMEWSKRKVHCTMHICWGAQAGLYFHYGVPKYSLPCKLSGVYQHVALSPNSPIFRGLDDRFCVPHSRYTEVRGEDIRRIPSLELMAVSEEAGVFMVKSADSRQFFITGHPEYDRETLALEYRRDKAKGLDVSVPAHYFPLDDPARTPPIVWKSSAQLMYNNWLNYYVYQTTPYVLTNIGGVAGIIE